MKSNLIVDSGNWSFNFYCLFPKIQSFKNSAYKLYR